MPTPPAAEVLSGVASRAHYHGSPEHKRHPSFAGPPAPRATASLCDPRFANQQELLTHWLREAIENGQVSSRWDGDFPRNVWIRKEGVVYEGRLVNQGTGAYKGWPLEEFEVPEELK
jgi:hypothetical protein